MSSSASIGFCGNSVFISGICDFVEIRLSSFAVSAFVGKGMKRLSFLEITVSSLKGSDMLALFEISVYSTEVSRLLELVCLHLP